MVERTRTESKVKRVLSSASSKKNGLYHSYGLQYSKILNYTFINKKSLNPTPIKSVVFSFFSITDATDSLKKLWFCAY